MDHARVDLLDAEALERLYQRFERPLDVDLEDDVHVLHVAAVDLAEERVERDGLAIAARGQPCSPPLLGLALGHLLRAAHLEALAGRRHLVQAHHLDRRGRPGRADAVALVVGHRSDAAGGQSADHGVTLVEGAGLDQQRRHHPALSIAGRLDHDADRRPLGVCPGLAQV